MREQGAVGKQERHSCTNARADSSPPDYHKRYPRQLGSIFDNLDPTRNEQPPVGISRKPHSLNMSLRRIKFPTFKRFLQLKRAMYHLVTNRLASHAESIAGEPARYRDRGSDTCQKWYRTTWCGVICRVLKLMIW